MDETDSSAVRSRSKRFQKHNDTGAESLVRESARRLSRYRSLFGSRNSFRSQVPGSSMGVEIPSVQASFSIRAYDSTPRHNTHSITSSSSRREFDELISGVGTQMEDDLYRLITVAGLNRAFDGQNISRWQFDMQSRSMPLGVLERRRHTAPATHLIGSPAGTPLTL